MTEKIFGEKSKELKKAIKQHKANQLDNNKKLERLIA